VRYRAQNARALARLLHAELQASAIRKPAPKTRSGSPGSKADPRSRNPRAPIDLSGGGRRVLWAKPR
jgi:hypothetical protein